MVFINDSLNVVLLGDWNQLYSQPDWIAENVFEKEEMEIGLSGQGTYKAFQFVLQLQDDFFCPFKLDRDDFFVGYDVFVRIVFCH